MTENVLHQNEYIEHIAVKYKRKLAALALGAILFTGVVNEGWRFSPTEVVVEPKTYEQLKNTHQGNAYILTENILKVDEIYQWSHRSANTKESIDEAVEMGARILDMDVSYIDGEFYVEHGSVYKKQVLGVDFALVLDQDELELTTKAPARLEDLIEHIAAISNPGISGAQVEKIAVTIQFKKVGNGLIEDEGLVKIVDILLRHRVPAIIQSKNESMLYTIRHLYNARLNAPSYVQSADLSVAA